LSDLAYASDDLKTESLDDTNMSVTNHSHTHIYIVPLRRGATPTLVNSCNECYNNTHDNTENKTK